jgi:hypothetical protein
MLVRETRDGGHMKKMPEGTYVLAVSTEDKNPDGTPEHSVLGPIEEDRFDEWGMGPGQLIAESGDEWEFYATDDVLLALADIGIRIDKHIIVNDPWPTDEGFTKSAIYLA